MPGPAELVSRVTQAIAARRRPEPTRVPFAPAGWIESDNARVDGVTYRELTPDQPPRTPFEVSPRAELSREQVEGVRVDAELAARKRP